MYINDIHILYYVLIGAIGIITGQFMDWCNKRMPEYKKIISKDFFTKYLTNFKPNYALTTVNAVINVGVLFFLSRFSRNLDLIVLTQYILLVPMLLSAFTIDFKMQIIPNRLNLTMFETGLIFTFIQGITNINIAVEMLLGMLVGGGIFLLITVIGGLIAGKEAMGFGDVKLMGALGLFFGWRKIIAIAIISFAFAAIISIPLMIFNRKKSSEYIPFGPFIVMAAIVVMCAPFNWLVITLFKIFSLGMYR